jgi:DNA-binding MarR family transcriptional regulator
MAGGHIVSRNHQKSVAGRLVAAARLYRSRVGSALGPVGLHAGQEGILYALADADGQSMTDLAGALGVQPPTVTKMVGRLAAQGYVQRRASKTDARQAQVFLTSGGRKALNGLDEIIDGVEETALSGINGKDRKKLRSLLRQVADNLDGGGAGDDADTE